MTFQQLLLRQIRRTKNIWAHVVPNHGSTKFIREWLAAPYWLGAGVRPTKQGVMDARVFT